MFATLAGGYPWSPSVPPSGSVDDAVRLVLAEQAEAGLEPLTDGGLRWPDPVAPLVAGLSGLTAGGSAQYPGTGRAATGPVALAAPGWNRPITVDAWAFAAGETDRAVKQVLPGPYTLGRFSDVGSVGRERLTLGLAEALNAELRALAAAGCPLVQVDEEAAALIGDDPSERRLFRDAQRRLTDGVEGIHLSLAILGGNAEAAGAATIFEAPYRSYLLNLVEGPDNWRLAVEVPADRGIICGALDSRPGVQEVKEVLVWAAHYAASTRGRGLDRVGLATAGSLGELSWEEARERIRLLGESARLAALGPGEELARSLDPRAVDIRSAAFGRFDPRPPRREGRP